MQDHTEQYLTEEEQQLLLRIARETLEVYLEENRVLTLENYPLTKTLRSAHGAFVTLHSHGQLRGCIGYIANTLPLAETVRENVVNAATRDPRFSPVTEAELDDIEIEISALTPGDSPETPFKEVGDISEIVIGRDGLYIESPPMHGGILLPQVAVEQDWDVDQFLVGVCQKAGYADDAWKDPKTRLYRFSAQIFSESEKKDKSGGDNV